MLNTSASSPEPCFPILVSHRDNRTKLYFWQMAGSLLCIFIRDTRYLLKYPKWELFKHGKLEQTFKH